MYICLSVRKSIWQKKIYQLLYKISWNSWRRFSLLNSIQYVMYLGQWSVIHFTRHRYIVSIFFYITTYLGTTLSLAPLWGIKFDHMVIIIYTYTPLDNSQENVLKPVYLTSLSTTRCLFSWLIQSFIIYLKVFP